MAGRSRSIARETRRREARRPPLPGPPQCGRRAREAPAQALAPLQLPGRLGFGGEEWSAVQLEQALRKAVEPGAACGCAGRALRGIDLGDQFLEGPGIDPEVAPVERELAFVQDQGAVLAQQLAQPVQRARERAVRRIAVDARPQRFREPLDAERARRPARSAPAAIRAAGAAPCPTAGIGSSCRSRLKAPSVRTRKAHGQPPSKATAPRAAGRAAGSGSST